LALINAAITGWNMVCRDNAAVAMFVVTSG
jgi:hypothetical protein